MPLADLAECRRAFARRSPITPNRGVSACGGPALLSGRDDLRVVRTSVVLIVASPLAEALHFMGGGTTSASSAHPSSLGGMTSASSAFPRSERVYPAIMPLGAISPGDPSWRKASRYVRTGRDDLRVVRTSSKANQAILDGVNAAVCLLVGLGKLVDLIVRIRKETSK